MHTLLNPNIKYKPESEQDALSRYTGFGKEIFNVIYREIPSLAGSFVFFRDTATEDIWSICETCNYSFGLQLDPDIEVICLWNASNFEEIGKWQENPAEYAVHRIKTFYANDT